MKSYSNWTNLFILTVIALVVAEHTCIFLYFRQLLLEDKPSQFVICFSISTKQPVSIMDAKGHKNK